MIDIFNSYVPKFIVNLQTNNEDITYVSSSYLSAEGDVYKLDKRILTPILTQTTQSLQELKPETSDMYPFKIVTPIDVDGSTVILSPSVTAEPTASQGYYTPIYFERYQIDFLRNIDKTFSELTTGNVESAAVVSTAVVEDITNVQLNTTQSTTSTTTAAPRTPLQESLLEEELPPSAIPIVTVAVDEQYARRQAKANNIIWENYIHVKTVDGGWAIMSSNPAFSSIIEDYRNGVYGSTIVREGVRLMIRPRREYLNQLTVEERSFIIS